MMMTASESPAFSPVMAVLTVLAGGVAWIGAADLRG
jgi:hypothetical protein